MQTRTVSKLGSPNLMSRMCSLLLDKYGSLPPLGLAVPLDGLRLRITQNRPLLTCWLSSQDKQELHS